MTTEPDTLESLRVENARFSALLDSNGINWKKPSRTVPALAPAQLGSDAKVALFRRLFAGRADVYPLRWESKSGKSGYAPACANEWRPGVCEKPRIKCT